MKVGLLIALTIVGVFVASTVRSASAIEGSVRIEAARAFVGETVDVDIIANVGPPGLGAWTVDVTYDSAIVTRSRCVGFQGTLCGIEFGPETDRVTGATKTGLIGETTLARFEFECGEPGTSDLELSIEVFADATPGNPQDIDEDVEEGAITCAESTPKSSGTLTIDSATMHVGETARILVHGRNMPIDPGLGAWTFAVSYEASVAQAHECLPRPLPIGDTGNNDCYVVFDALSVVVRGASAMGLPPNYDFAEIVVGCNRPGESRLTVSAALWAIPPVQLESIPLAEGSKGSITCLERATSYPPKPPPTGAGGATTDSAVLWPSALLATFGITAIANAAFALRRRA